MTLRTISRLMPSWQGALLGGSVPTAISSSSMMSQSGSPVLSCAICEASSACRKWYLASSSWDFFQVETSSPDGRTRVTSAVRLHLPRTTSTAWPSLFVNSLSEMNLRTRHVWYARSPFCTLSAYAYKELQVSPSELAPAFLVEPCQRAQPRSLARSLTCPPTRFSSHCWFALVVPLTQLHQNRHKVFNTFVGVCEAISSQIWLADCGWTRPRPLCHHRRWPPHGRRVPSHPW